MTDFRFSRVPIMAGAGLGAALGGVEDLPKPKLSRFCDLFASFSGLYCASDAFVTVCLRPMAAGAVIGEAPNGEAEGGLASANWYASGSDITVDNASSGLLCPSILYDECTLVETRLLDLLAIFLAADPCPLAITLPRFGEPAIGRDKFSSEDEGVKGILVVACGLSCG